MIDRCLSFMMEELNQFLNLKFTLTQDKVVISSIVKQNGQMDSDFAVDSIALMVTNIEEENTLQSVTKFVERESSLYRVSPDMLLNIKILMALNFTRYSEALKFLSAILEFYQSKPVFNSTNSPQFNFDDIDQLRVKFVSLTSEQQNHLWGAIGAKLMPFLLYKVSLLKVQENKFAERIPKIDEINSQLIQQ